MHCVAGLLGSEAATAVCDKLACENSKDEDFLFILDGRYQQVGLSMLPSQKQIIQQTLAAKEDAMLCASSPHSDQSSRGKPLLGEASLHVPTHATGCARVLLCVPVCTSTAQ